jgi:cytochrome c553
MRKVLRVVAIALGVVVILLVLAGAGAYVMGSRAWDRQYDVPTASLVIPTDDSSVARGRHLAGIYGCVDCHGPDLAGTVIADDTPFRIVAPNLTAGRGGVGGSYTPTDWDRSVRHGVRPNGTSLFIMPARAYHRVADNEMAQLIAYLQRLPPVDSDHPEREIRPLGRLLAAGPMVTDFEVMREPTQAMSPPPDSTVEYGAYLTAICAYCHGDDLRGMQPPDPASIHAPDLSGAGKWTWEQFDTALRTGARPNGIPINPQFMPYSITARMTDAERRAIHMRLGQLEE